MIHTESAPDARNFTALGLSDSLSDYEFATAQDDMMACLSHELHGMSQIRWCTEIVGAQLHPDVHLAHVSV